MKYIKAISIALILLMNLLLSAAVKNVSGEVFTETCGG